MLQYRGVGIGFNMTNPEGNYIDANGEICSSAMENKLKLLMKLRSSGIRDVEVMAAIESIAREEFVMPIFADKAYEDTALPIACGQTISQPSLVAFMTESLQVNDRMRVLEIGTGSGYQTAILSKLCRMVYTIERHEGLYIAAKEIFDKLQLHNITSRCADGYNGWPEAAPFDRIMVTAAAPEVPEMLLAQMSENNGIMIIPVGRESGKQVLQRITRTENDFFYEELMGVRFVPMVSGVAEH